MVGLRWSIRGIGLLSTIILARLLVPEDFGLVALATLFASLLDVLTSFGVDMALIQRQDSSRAHYDTAWTIKIIQTAFVALLMILASPFAAELFREPRVTGLMLFVSMSILISGLENIGIVAFRKELEFHKEFGYRVTIKLTRFCVTVVLAYLLRSYWALVWGSLVTRIVGVVLSYFVQSYRPRITLSRVGDLWSFSQWMLVRNIGMYLRRRFDGFAVGRYFSSGSMGIYSLAKEIAELPTTELIWPMGRVLFPSYVRLVHDPKRLGRAYLKSLSVIAMMAVPAGAGVALVAEPLVFVLLGERYAQVGPVLVWLALYNVLLTLAASVQSPLMALGRMRRVAGLVWLQSILAIPVIVVAALQRDLVIIAQAQLAVAVVLVPLFFFFLISAALFGWLDLVKSLWRPALATSVMALALSGVPDVGGAVGALAIKIPLGIAMFSFVEFACWQLSGRPDGAERLFLDIVARKVLWKNSNAET